MQFVVRAQLLAYASKEVLDAQKAVVESARDFQARALTVRMLRQPQANAGEAMMELHQVRLLTREAAEAMAVQLRKELTALPR